jgi:hypothetical protein
MRLIRYAALAALVAAAGCGGSAEPTAEKPLEGNRGVALPGGKRASMGDPNKPAEKPER